MRQWQSNFKAELSYASDVISQSPSHSIGDKICDADTISSRGKLLVFKLKALIFHIRDFFLYKHFLVKMDQILGFWASQSLKSNRNTCFRGFKSSLVVKSHVVKPGRLALPKNVNFNFWSFKRCPYDNDFGPINLGGLNIILGAWNGFPSNFRESCDQVFYLKWISQYI